MNPVPFLFLGAGAYLLWKQQAAAPGSGGSGTAPTQPQVVAEQVGSNFVRNGSDLGDAVHGLTAGIANAPYANASAQTAEGQVNVTKTPTGSLYEAITAQGKVSVDTRPPPTPTTKSIPRYWWTGAGLGYVAGGNVSVPYSDSRTVAYQGGPKSNYP